MVIGVTLKDALKSGCLAVVPLDTDFVEPSLEDIKTFCMKELSTFFPEDAPTGKCEVLNLELVIGKIKSARERPIDDPE